jgi:hypothetical protein
MKAVLIATDFLKDIDNSFKIIETNTNIHIVAKNISNYFNINEFDEFLSTNNIDTIEFIRPVWGYSGVYDLDEERDQYNPQLDSIFEFLSTHYSGSSITLNVHNTERSAITIPNIEDGPNKLILRMSYDATALIDDTYARDNWELLKLLYDGDPTSIPATYINEPIIGFDTIGTEIRDNEEFPNYIIKQRYPTTNYKLYPKVLKIDTIEQLDSVKNSLLSEEYLQEYIYNPNDLTEGKLKTYRTITMVYGSNLDTFNFMSPYEHTNPTAPSETVDYDVNGFIQPWERPSFIQKLGNSNVKSTYHFDDTSKIILSNGSVIGIDDISVGSSLKTLNIDGLPLDEQVHLEWSEDYTALLTGTTETTTIIETINWIESSEWLMNVTLEGGIKFVDVPNSVFLSKITNDSEKVLFKKFININIGDYFIVYDLQTNSFLQKLVDNIEYSYEKLKVYTVDVEPYDAFLTTEDDVTNPRYGILQHNFGSCAAYCCSNELDPWVEQCPAYGFGGIGYCFDTDSYQYCLSTGQFNSGCFQCAPGCGLDCIGSIK